MTGLAHDDTRFEQDLRAVLADLAPDAAPASLRAAVAAVPGRRERQAPGRGRALIAVLGLAAAVVVAVAGIGLLTGPRSILPAGDLPTGGVPTAVPSPSAATATLTFRVLTPDGTTATKAQVLSVESVMEARLQAYGIGPSSSSGGDDRITFEVPLPSADPASLASVRDLLGTTGAFSIALLGPNPLEPGEPVTGPPLFTGEAVTDARIGTDQNGIPTLDLTVDARAAAALASATGGHVGDYLAIALDGVAVAVPVINDEITGGQIQVSFAADDTTAARLAAILQAGPLPLPVEQVEQVTP
jgi:preprotein translocase subunit SecD